MLANKYVLFVTFYVISMRQEASTIELLPMLLIPRTALNKLPNSESILWEKEFPSLDVSTSAESVNTAAPIAPKPTTTSNPVISVVNDEIRNDSGEFKKQTPKPKRKVMTINRDDVIINSNKPKSQTKKQLAISDDEIAMAKIISDVNFMITNDQKPASSEKRRGGNRGRVKSVGRKNSTAAVCDSCITSCSSDKKPICAKPLEEQNVDPDTLRGFPTICHMNCFNTCRKIKYEFFSDGKCGRFRNKVKTLDSDKKLTRSELDSAKYDIYTETSSEVSFVPTII